MGIFLGYFILEWALRTIDHGEIIVYPLLIIIPILAILGALIGYFFGNRIYEFMSKGTRSSSGVGGDTRVMLRIIFGIIGGILLISGVILTFFDVGLSGNVLNLDGLVLYVTPLGITFLVVGLILLVIVIGVVTKGGCLECLAG